MIQDGGAVVFTPIQEMLESLTIKKIGKLINFEQLEKEFGKTISIVTYNLTKKKKEIISTKTHPEMPCIIAIRMSCTLPFVFPPYEYDKSLYLDGGLVENFPISLITSPTETIAINLAPIPSTQNTNSPLPRDFNPVSYGVNVLNIPINEAIKLSLQEAKDKNIQLVNIHSNTFGFEFDMNTTQRLDLFSIGYNAAKEQYLNN